VRTAAAVAVLLLTAADARAQDYDGYFSALFIVMPDVDAAGGRQGVAELRTRLFAEGLYDPGERVHVRAGVFVDTLAGDRGVLDPGGSAADAVVRPADLFVEYRGERIELRAGSARVVWGRLDEFQPTDVVNPIDLSRFLLEGRSEARLPVAMVRGRIFLPRAATIEGILVPVFRAGRFDQLDEETSPFQLVPPGRRERRQPGVAWRNMQGGARVSSTVARIDWSVSAWRGFESFPTYSLVPGTIDPLSLTVPTFVESFPRFTMVGGDFETVRGAWGLRGEAAWFDGATPRSFEGGIGTDRRAGEYRVAIDAVLSHADDTDVTLVASAERTFASDTRRARLLAVVDPADETAFVRGTGAINLRENLWMELSAGWFTGEAQATAVQSGVDVLGLLSRRDFVYAHLKFHF
jgi:hypothetical protein